MSERTIFAYFNTPDQAKEATDSSMRLSTSMVMRAPAFKTWTSWAPPFLATSQDLAT